MEQYTVNCFVCGKKFTGNKHSFICSDECRSKLRNEFSVGSYTSSGIKTSKSSLSKDEYSKNKGRESWNKKYGTAKKAIEFESLQYSKGVALQACVICGEEFYSTMENKMVCSINCYRKLKPEEKFKIKSKTDIV